MNSGCGMQASATLPTVFIGLGSNLGASQQIITAAFSQLQAWSDHPLRTSSLWQTTPVDCPPDSPKFVNAVAGLLPRVGETPESLLHKLQSLEKSAGRWPKVILNEPRPLDLDLIAFGSEIRQSAGLILPHPRAHLRRFVLQPLWQIAPELVFPGQVRNVAELLADLVSEENVTQI